MSRPTAVSLHSVMTTAAVVNRLLLIAAAAPPQCLTRVTLTTVTLCSSSVTTVDVLQVNHTRYHCRPARHSPIQRIMFTAPTIWTPDTAIGDPMHLSALRHKLIGREFNMWAMQVRVETFTMLHNRSLSLYRTCSRFVFTPSEQTRSDALLIRRTVYVDVCLSTHRRDGLVL